uniref:DNA-directed RNA polymerase I subunit RPA49 n=1 Tax=Phaeomonas parva TaxID=124430 RepID=A0A7S1TNW0_9STRA|mmetsp:Transcript_10874/g.33070  ORF Transcript_10874/g.33070 Transcript_10874/m.33070 type:complete len:439 (+) Transcript_10874:317-1633(+)
MAKVKNVKVEEGQPLLLSFAAGVPVNAGELSFEPAGGHWPKRRRLAATRGVVRYRTEACAAPAAAEFAVAVFDKASGEVTLLRNCEVQRVVQEYTNVAAADDDLAEADYNTKRRLLTDAFGSQKKKRAQRQQDSNVISKDGINNLGSLTRRLGSMAGEGDDGAAAAAGGSPATQAALVEQLMQDSVKRTLPRFNKEAAKAADVFSMPDVCTEKSFFMLKDKFAAIVRGEAGDDEEASAYDVAGTFGLSSTAAYPSWLPHVLAALAPGPKWPGFAKARIVGFANQLGEEPLKKGKKGALDKFLGCLVYRYLMTLAHARDFMEEGEVATATGMPAEVVRFMCKPFRVQTRRGATRVHKKAKEQTTRLQMHLCALAVLLNDFTVDLGEIAADFKFDEMAMPGLYRKLGCKVGKKKTGSGVKAVAKLMVPLDFPKQRRPVRR